MTETTRYCRSCQRRFSVAAEEQRCPQCGETLGPWGDHPTLELDSVSFAPVSETHVEADEGEPVQELVGQELAQYRIERFLGQGGMARVYLARHLTLERPCAIKVLRARTQQTQQALESFLAEARAAAALVHPHVVALHSIGEVGGRHFIEMEYVAGRSLAEVARAAGRLEPLEATRFMLQISSALAAAHQMGMVHRDIKPANVMVTAAGDAKLADFGLAKRLTKGQSSAGALCGTPNYMAPELFAGQAASQRSDIYAMGVTYFSLLIGRLPVETNSLTELMRFHTVDECEFDWELAADEIPAGVLEVLQRCLAREPGERYQDASALHAALRAVFGTLRSLGSLLREALAAEPLEIEGVEPQFTIRVPLDQGRSQTVRVEGLADVQTRESIIRVFSICGPATAAYYEKALHLNAAVSHGAIAIEEVAGSPHFVMVNAYPRATCDPEEIHKSVFDIARHSDELEQLLTGADRH